MKHSFCFIRLNDLFLFKQDIYLIGIQNLFHEYEIHSRNQTDESSKMIPMQRFAFKKDCSEYSKNNKGYHFLNYLQLH